MRAPDVDGTRAPHATAAPAVRSDHETGPAPGPGAAETAAAVAEVLAYGPPSGTALEQTLAELVRAAREDWPLLRGALAEATEKFALGERRADLPAATPLRQLHHLVDVLVWLPAPAGERGARLSLGRLLDRLDLPLDRPAGADRFALRTPADILTLRLAEIAARIGSPSQVDLVSTPTDPAGWIAPETLVARITAAEDAGWQPWPIDLDQALLRLPVDAKPTTIRSAHDLASPAGRRLAGWLRGGYPTLPAVAHPFAEPPIPPLAEPSAAIPLPLARLRTAPGGPLTPITLVHLLRRGWNAPGPLADGSCWADCWPGLLPAQADLVAAAASWHPRHPDAHGTFCEPHLLTRIARGNRLSGGIRPGHGMTAALARAVISRSATERADAAGALRLLAGSGQLDGTQLAAALSRFAVQPERQILRAVTPILRQALDQSRPAATTRAATTISTAILHWLPAILPPAVPAPLPYTAHLLDTAYAGLATLQEYRQRQPSIPAHTAELLLSLAERSARSSVSAAARRLVAPAL